MKLNAFIHNFFTFKDIIQCAGNRRTEMSKRRTVKGVGWDACALGTGLNDIYGIGLASIFNNNGYISSYIRTNFNHNHSI